MPRCLSLPSLLRSPPQISRSEWARPSWQNSMATNCPQHVNPRAWRSACVRFTRAWNSVRGNSLRSWLNMLENPLTGEPPSCGSVEAWLPRQHHTSGAHPPSRAILDKSAIWYSYEPGGEIRIITARSSRKGKLLEQAGRFSLCAQAETPPYKYVSVEGPIVAIEGADLERDRRPLAHRYFGDNW